MKRTPTELLLATLMVAGLSACGPTDPNANLDVQASFVGNLGPDVCTFVFHAEATPADVEMLYAYQLRIMNLIAPTTWAPTIPLEDSVGTFTGSLDLSWDVSMATQSQVARFIRYRITTPSGFVQEDEFEYICPPQLPQGPALTLGGS